MRLTPCIRNKNAIARVCFSTETAEFECQREAQGEPMNSKTCRVYQRKGSEESQTCRVYQREGSQTCRVQCSVCQSNLWYLFYFTG